MGYQRRLGFLLERIRARSSEPDKRDCGVDEDFCFQTAWYAWLPCGTKSGQHSNCSIYDWIPDSGVPCLGYGRAEGYHGESDATQKREHAAEFVQGWKRFSESLVERGYWPRS